MYIREQTEETIKEQNLDRSRVSGSFDMLHLTEDYGSVLGKRLERGETVNLPFDEGYSVNLSNGTYVWFMIFQWQDRYDITVETGCQRRELEFPQQADGDRFNLKLDLHTCARGECVGSAVGYRQSITISTPRQLKIPDSPSIMKSEKH